MKKIAKKIGGGAAAAALFVGIALSSAAAPASASTYVSGHHVNGRGFLVCATNLAMHKVEIQKQGGWGYTVKESCESYNDGTGWYRAIVSYWLP